MSAPEIQSRTNSNFSPRPMGLSRPVSARARRLSPFYFDRATTCSIATATLPSSGRSARPRSLWSRSFCGLLFKRRTARYCVARRSRTAQLTKKIISTAGSSLRRGAPPGSVGESSEMKSPFAKNRLYLRSIYINDGTTCSIGMSSSS